ncbi:MAG: dTMP kinase [Lachnospiraceae bacterium]
MVSKMSNKQVQRKKGPFVALEGIDGSGKSTQVQLLIEKMKEENIPCYATMEPTDSPIGSLIHQIMMGRIKTDNKVIAALFVADRLDHLLNDINGIAAKIEEGISVVSDRYYFSSYAYHGVDMPMEWVINANEQSSNILRPTVNIFIDVAPDIAMERIAKNRFQQELFEKKSRLVSVREKYLEAFEKLKNSEIVIIIDGNQSPQEIAKDIWEEVKKYYII